MSQPTRTTESFVASLRTKLPIDGAAFKRLNTMIGVHAPANLPTFYQALKELGIAFERWLPADPGFDPKETHR